MKWVVPRMWEKEDVWILGGGPSVAKQFGIPEKVVQSVRDKASPPSVFSPYMECIHNKHVIGINVAFMIGDWMDMIFFGDEAFFKRYGEQLAIYPGLKVTCTSIPTSHDLEWIKYIPKNGDKPRGLSYTPDKISWNWNSGAAAINVATHAGANRIFLLGFDMSLDEKDNQHWHDVYNRGKINTEDKLKSWQPTVSRHLKGFEAIKKDANELGVEIINVSPESKIKEFPKLSLKDVI